MEAPVILDPPSRGGSLQESSDEDDQPLRNRMPDRGKSWRNVGAFWLLGLCNNFSYVIMLSAAHDILSEQEGGNVTGLIPGPNDTRAAELSREVTVTGGGLNGTSRYDCNPISTAAILLADILPTLLIKLTAPFYIQHLPYGYFSLLVKPPILSDWNLQPPPRAQECQPIIQPRSPEVTESRLTLRKKVVIIRSLLKYMLPLGLVYFAEYFINQGLFELLYFRNTLFDHDSQYRWYQALYQFGVFISRSSANCFRLRKIWILALLQVLILSVLSFDVWFCFIPSIWIVFFIILCEGLLGGAGYVNTFRNISLEVPEEEREFAMGAASMADTLGIALSGALAVPFHNWLCRLD
ncbi:battenin isoform X2 [Carcharodon carcharias]|uniref:battenin isoform X2 n=1 Tax=Carcharodon carcharias TaxID=13397 RepID=UPI001B7EF8A7|nr:battenin isoform X2 [Carcharodon carcharias]